MSKSSLLTIKEAEETWQNDQAEDLKQKFAMFSYKHWPGRSLNAKKWKHTSLDTVVVDRTILYFFCTELGH